MMPLAASNSAARTIGTLVFVGVAGLAIYRAVVTFASRTVVFIASDGSMIIRQEPLPWKNLRFPSGAVCQLHCGFELSQGKTSSFSVSYCLFGTARDGREKKIVDRLLSREEATQLKEILERGLHITGGVDRQLA
jgi:hypothetical protein